MKIWFQRFLLCLVLTSFSAAKASEASDEYVSIYSLITKGDEMLGSGLRAEAAQFYSDAHRKLVAFRGAHPDWNHQVVRFRLKYLGEKLAELPETVVPEVTSTFVPSSSTSNSGQPVLASQNRMLEGQVAALNEQMRQLTADNSLLLSKLREAMSARPAEVDPSQVRKAEKKILELEKENELIELQLQKALKTKPAPQPKQASPQAVKMQREAERAAKEVRELRAQVARINADLSDAKAANQSLEKQLKDLSVERDDLKSKQRRASKASESKEMKNLRQENARLAQRLSSVENEFVRFKAGADRSAEIASLTNERNALRQQVQNLSGTNDQRDVVEKLMRENALLKRQASPTEVTEVTQVTDDDLKDELAELKKENRKLANQLAKARRSGDRGGWLPRFGRRGDREQSVIEARLAVLEAEKEPYSSDELALLKGAALADLELDGSSASTKAETTPLEVSQAAAALEAAAQTAARAGQFNEAERKYNEILDMIPNHAPTLASLALTQLKQGKTGEAEANLEMAVDIAPENTYALFLSGLVKMSQERFDEAVTFLSRATVLDPDDAEAQNHLGIALTEVGHRGPAEAALRKAIRLRPGYGEAHINLAVVYASQTPPFKELAKYHYQQALNSGHPEDPRIQQLIDKN